MHARACKIHGSQECDHCAFYGDQAFSLNGTLIQHRIELVCFSLHEFFLVSFAGASMLQLFYGCLFNVYSDLNHWVL